MPTYDYVCAGCGGFEALRRLADRDAPMACPGCGGRAERVPVAPQLTLLDPGIRRALQLNERAAHEPLSSRDAGRLRHPAGCGCCRPGPGGTGLRTTASGLKSPVNRRPWMISH